MKGPESNHLNVDNLKQAAGGQFEAEVDQPLGDEELENIAGGMQGPGVGIDPSQLRKDQPEGSGLPKPLKSKGVMGN